LWRRRRWERRRRFSTRCARSTALWRSTCLVWRLWIIVRSARLHQPARYIAWEIVKMISSISWLVDRSWSTGCRLCHKFTLIYASCQLYYIYFFENWIVYFSRNSKFRFIYNCVYKYVVTSICMCMIQTFYHSLLLCTILYTIFSYNFIWILML